MKASGSGLAIVCAALFVLSSCAGLAPASRAAPAPKPQLSEGQLQERYLSLRNEGRRLLEAKRYGAALDSYLAANEIRPNAAEILLGVGQAYLGLEYWDRAKLWFDRYLAAEKDRDPAVYRLIARLYGDRLEAWDLAVKVWSKAIDASADAPQAQDFWFRGLALQNLGRKDDAVADFRSALDLARKAKDDKLAAQATNAMAALAGSR